MIKKTVLVLVGICCAFISSAQKESYNWYFGDRAGITFNTNPPTALTNSKMYTNEGCASMSTSTGRLLFYTDGMNVWDSTHKLMPNGTGLKGSATSTQSAIIVPRPDSAHLYYIFTVAPEGIADGLQYSELNMKLNAGKGDIISTMKNIKLRSAMCEKITAVQKNNLNEYWVLSAKFNTDSFYAYSVTNAGVNYIPVGYRTGLKIFGVGTNAIGYLKVSADSRKVAFANSTFDTSAIGDFDAVTGKISNLWKFYNYKGYGIEFSPKTRYLYVTEEGNKKVFQYDLKSSSQANFIASKKAIDSGYNYSPAALQVGPDGKIYISSVNDQYLSVIKNPDSSMCQPQKNYLYLSSGRYSHYGLPSFMKTFFQDTDFVVQRNCVNDSTTFSIGFSYSLDSLRWDFGDPGSGINNTSQQLSNVTHVYKKSGQYNVTLTTYRGITKKIFKVSFKIYQRIKPFLGKDTAICNTFNNLVLQPQKSYLNYFWPSDGSNLPTMNISQKGIYIINVKDTGECWMADTIRVTNPTLSAKIKFSDTALCLDGNNFSLTDTSIYKDCVGIKSIWNFGDGTYQTGLSMSKSYSQSGNYNVRLTVESNTNCKDSMNKTITVFAQPKVTLGNDTILCSPFSHVLKTGSPFSKYNWNSGETTQQITITAKGTYILKIRDINNCDAADTVLIDAIDIPAPTIQLSYDTVECKYTYLTVDSSKGLTFLWSTGETGKQIKVMDKGWYKVTGRIQFCSSSDSVLINSWARPIVNLGPDTSLCTNELILKTTESGTYLWSTTETRPSLDIRTPGKYWLTVTRNKCSATDTVNITICGDLQYFVPNVFSPNDDNTNEVFRIYGTNITHVEMEIFNRWGEQLLKTEGKDPFWDGSYQNTLCMDDLYYYKVTIKGKKAGSVAYLNGSIMLLK